MTKKKATKKQVIIIFCTKCHSSQDYSPKGKFGFDPKSEKYFGDSKRRHKECRYCHKNFEIKKLSQNKEFEFFSNYDPLEKVKLDLNDSDRKILEALLDDKNQFKDLTQKDISDKTGLHLSTISRHLKNLIQLGLIKIVKNIIGNFKSLIFYRIDENYLKNLPDTPDPKTPESDPDINIIQCHRMDIKIPIISDMKKFSVKTFHDHKEVITVKVIPMGFQNSPSWHRYNVVIRDVVFQFKLHVVEFTVSGYGNSSQKAIDNVKEKAEYILEWIQNEFPIQLGTINQIQYSTEKYPDGDKRAKHLVNLRMKNDEYLFLSDPKLCWTDKSHPGTIESSSTKFTDFFQDIGLTVNYHSEQLTDINSKLEAQDIDCCNQIIQAIEKMKIDLASQIKTEHLTLINEMVPSIKEGIIEALQKTEPSSNEAPKNMFT